MSLAKVRRLLVLLTLLVPGLARGQTSMGTVNGTVTDSTGAVVPGATVTLLNRDDGRPERARDQLGRPLHVFVNVRPGTYTLTVELAGFNKAHGSPTSCVGVNETVTRNVTLEVGEVTRDRRGDGPVRAAADADRPSSATSIEERVIEDVPLQGRNFTQLLLLTPGVNPVSTAQGAGPERRRLHGDQQLRRQLRDPRRLHRQRLDPGAAEPLQGLLRGRDHQHQRARGHATSRCRTSTRCRSSRCSRTATRRSSAACTGGVVNMTSKSGSNRFHGSVFGFFRNEGFTARNPYRDVSAGQATKPPEFQQSQFGVNIGGPIVKDKTFFFASYDGWRYREFAQIRHIVPTNDNWLNGDFSGFRGRSTTLTPRGS